MVLAHFKPRGVVREAGHRRLRLEQPDLFRAMIWSAWPAALRHCALSTRLKLQQMSDFAELRTCRWAYVVQYFGQDDRAFGLGGHCDRCQARGNASDVGASRPSAPRRARSAGAETNSVRRKR